jgi:hypothetical protein
MTTPPIHTSTPHQQKNEDIHIHSNMSSNASMTLSSNPTKSSSRIFQPIQLKGVELPVLSRYAFALGVLIVCILTLLWSRLDLRETRVNLSKAQHKYKGVIEEQHRLQLELDALLAPSSIRGTINDFDFTPNINVVEMNETTETQPNTKSSK